MSQADSRIALDFASALTSLSTARAARRARGSPAPGRRYRVLEPESAAQRTAGMGRLLVEFHTLDLALQFARDQLAHARPVVVLDMCRDQLVPLEALLGIDQSGSASSRAR